MTRHRSYRYPNQPERRKRSCDAVSPKDIVTIQQDRTSTGSSLGRKRRLDPPPNLTGYKPRTTMHLSDSNLNVSTWGSSQEERTATHGDDFYPENENTRHQWGSQPSSEGRGKMRPQPQQLHTLSLRRRGHDRRRVRGHNANHNILNLLWCSAVILLLSCISLATAQEMIATPVQCKLFMAVSDLNRDSFLNSAEFFMWLGRITGNKLTATSYETLPASLQALYTTHAIAANGEIDINGARPGTATITPTQGDNLDALCTSAETALAVANTGATTAPVVATATPATIAPIQTISPGTIPPQTVTPGTITPQTVNPAGTTSPQTTAPTTNVRVCMISLAVADRDRNNQLSETEYIAFVNRLTANKYATITVFASLPQPLQHAYNNLLTQSGAAVGTGLPITGASPAVQADAAQTAYLEQICSATDAALAAGTSTMAPGTVTPSVGGTALTPGTITPSTMGPGTITPSTLTPGTVLPTTISPGPATMAPTTPVRTCTLQMAVTDANRDGMMSPTDYLTFVNRLSANHWITVTTFEGLPLPLQNTYNQFAAGNEIDIFGASPAQTATEAQQLTLQNICAAVDQAIYQAKNPTLAPGTIGPSTLTPGTIGPSTLTPVGTVGPSTLTPIGTVGPSTLTPGTIGPGTIGPSTITPSTLTPGTGGPSTIAPSTLTPVGTITPSTLAPGTAGPTQDTSVCKIRLAGADRDRNSQLSTVEYVMFINFLTSNRYPGAAFTSLPTPLQNNFNVLVNATSGAIPITGASPTQAALATPEQIAFLDNFCIQTSTAIEAAVETTVPPTTINPGTPGNSTVSPGTPVPSTANPGTSAPSGNATGSGATQPPIDPNAPVVTIHSSFLLSSNRTAAQITEEMKFNRLPIEDAYQLFVETVVPPFVAALNGEESVQDSSNTSATSSPTTANPVAPVPETETPSNAATTIAPVATAAPNVTTTAAPETIPPIFNATMPPVSASENASTIPPTSTSVPPVSNATQLPTPAQTAATTVPGTPAASTQPPTAVQTPVASTISPQTVAPLPGTQAAATQLPTALQTAATTLPGTPAAATQLPTAVQTAGAAAATIAPIVRRNLRGYSSGNPMADPARVTASPAMPSVAEEELLKCTHQIELSDADGNCLLNELEYISFINRLSNYAFVQFTAIDTLPGPLSDNFKSLAPSGDIDMIEGTLVNICTATGQAIYLALYGTTGSIFSLSITAQTAGRRAQEVATVAPATVNPGVATTPVTAVPNTAVPSTTGPSTVVPGDPATTVPLTAVPGGAATTVPATVVPGPVVSNSSTVSPSTLGPSTGLPVTTTGPSVTSTTPPSTMTPSTPQPQTAGPSTITPQTAAPGSPATPVPNATRSPQGAGSGTVTLDSASAKIVRLENSTACPTGEPEDKQFCLVAFAEYRVMVSGDVNRQLVYDTLVDQTQGAIQDGELQAALVAVDNSTDVLIIGASDPPYVASSAPTTPPATPSPTDDPDELSETEQTYLGLALAGFLGIVLVLVCMTCVACACFGYVLYNLKQGVGNKQDVPTKDASDHDDFDDEDGRSPGGLANVEPATSSNSFGGFQVEGSGDGDLFFSNNDKDDDSTESEEKSSPEQAKDEEAEFGFEIGGPDLPDEFKVDIDKDGYSSEEDSEAKSGFDNNRESGSDDENEEGNDFDNSFNDDEKDNNGFFTAESNGFFGGGNDSWGGSQASEEEEEEEPNPTPPEGDGFGFDTDEGSSVYTDNEEEEPDQGSSFEESGEDDEYSSGEEDEDDEEVSDSDDELDEEEREAIREKIIDLVRDAAPHELDNIDMMMEQFAGREEELLETLRAMHSKKGEDADEESFESDEEDDEGDEEGGGSLDEGSLDEDEESQEGESYYDEEEGEEGESQYTDEEGESQFSGEEGESQYSDEEEGESQYSGEEEGESQYTDEEGESQFSGEEEGESQYSNEYDDEEGSFSGDEFSDERDGDYSEGSDYT